MPEAVNPRSSLRTWAVVLARLAVGALFGWAAVGKLMDPSAFAQDISNYQLLPDPVVAPVASILPVMELVIALSIVAGVLTRGAAACAALMLVAFTVGMGQAMARGINIECGCFGASAQAVVGWSSIARNGGLLAACCLVVITPESGLGWCISRRRTSAARGA